MSHSTTSDPKLPSTVSILVSLLVVALILATSYLAYNEAEETAQHAVVNPQLPYESFAYIEIKDVLEITGCRQGLESEDCLPRFEERDEADGSGVVVGPGLVLTVAHICQAYIKLEGEAQRFQLTAFNPPSIQEGTREAVMTVTTLGGKRHLAEISSMDLSVDLCTLKVEGLTALPVQVAKLPIARGERVYTMSAPEGFFDDDMVLTFDGFFSGVMSTNQVESAWTFTVPAYHGGSGSPIFNNRTELISVLFAGSAQMENVGLGIPLEDVRRFLEYNGSLRSR